MRHEEDSVDQNNNKVNKIDANGSSGSGSGSGSGNGSGRSNRICRSRIRRSSVRRSSIGCSSSSSTELEDLCVFCLNRIRDPFQLACKHLFCRSCFSRYREARNWRADRCPLCRRMLDPLPYWSRPKGRWSLKIMLILVFMLLSVGPFYLLLIFW